MKLLLGLVLCVSAFGQVKCPSLFLDETLLPRAIPAHIEVSLLATSGFSCAFDPPHGSSVSPGDYITAIPTSLPECDHLCNFQMQWTLLSPNGDRRSGGWTTPVLLNGIWIGSAQVPANAQPGDVFEACMTIQCCDDVDHPVTYMECALYTVT